MSDELELRSAQAEELRLAQAELRQLESAIVLTRYNFARRNGMTYEGARNMYSVLGYTEDITAAQYRSRYDRGGIAGRAVDMRPDATWRGEGEVFEVEEEKTVTAFEKAWRAFNDRLHIWPTFARADKLAAIHKYSVILIGAKDNADKELPKGKPEDILFLKPYDDQDMEVDTLDLDVMSPRFGQPVTYTFKRNTKMISGQKQIAASDIKALTVHYSRVIHIPSEGFLDDDVYGPPSLERVWNYLDDLDKIVGGGGEASWLRANPVTQLDLDKDVAYQGESDMTAQIEQLKAKSNELRHQLTRWIQTRGVKMSQLTGDVSDFKNNAEIIIALIAGSKGIPQRILLGTEAGSLASDQDRNNWNDQIADRRTAYAGPYIVRQFIDRMIAYNYLPKPAQYDIEWPDVRSMTETEKLDAAAKAAALNDHGQLIITNDEIRNDFLEREPIDPDLVEEFMNPAGQEEQIQQIKKQLAKGGTISLAVSR